MSTAKEFVAECSCIAGVGKAGLAGCPGAFGGCKTWVGMEPYPTPNIIRQDLRAILDRVSFADRVIFGRANYNKEVSSYPNVKDWYNEQAMQVIDYCQERGVDYYIKRGTLTEGSSKCEGGDWCNLTGESGSLSA